MMKVVVVLVKEYELVMDSGDAEVSIGGGGRHTR